VSLKNCNSSCLPLRADTPQGSHSEPYDFKLLINDPNYSIDYAKYVDDAIVAPVYPNPNDQALQTAVDHLSAWCSKNYIKIKTKKRLS
jgi:hypothetical protein